MKHFTIHSLFLYFKLGILFFLSSCTMHRLDVQTQYLSHENLASYYIGTPDPCQDNPTIGQRLLIQWSLSSCEVAEQELFLHLKVRFRNHKEEEIKAVINKKKGFFIFDLTNQKYCETGGVLTYIAEIRNEECVIECWKHPLWTELISFDYTQNKPDQSN
jgi:hypothetical protein